ncbi:hypothetical protein B0H13DRAFT_2376254 [Mycena leptocephala]|nr:hypothetical protein B0H13DRAFT_2376254 [Mycena leptocephala]
MLRTLHKLFAFGNETSSNSHSTDAPPSRGPPPPLPPRPGPPAIPPNKPVFAPQVPEYPPGGLGSQYTWMQQNNNLPKFDNVDAFTGHYPGIHPSYHSPHTMHCPPNILPLSHLPAQMPTYFQPHAYFHGPQQIVSPAFLPPMTFTGPTAYMPMTGPPPLPVSANPSSAPVETAVVDSPSYQWPDGNVKLECTVGQEPLGWDDEGWKWCSSGARRTGVPTAAFKVDKRICLGVFHCSCKDTDGLPRRFFRPETATNARNKQRSETCPICRSQLYKDELGNVNAVRHHLGRHSHAHPPLKRLSATDMEALDSQVLHNPQATAQQLRAAAAPGQVSLGEINPILLDPRKARSAVEKSKVRQQLISPAGRNTGFQFIESFSALKNSFETPWIVEANLLDRQFICMQTPFMREVLLRDSVQSWHAENLEAESRRHGVITDGTHDFFKQGILLTSLVFSQVLFRWVVVLYTWIGAQDQEHHLPHFKQLVYVMAEICTKGLGFTFDERLFSAILDFSNAQRNGFIDAFIDYMCSRIPGWSELSAQSQASERKNLRLRAQALLIGCKVHWRRSTHKIKQVIGIKSLFRFEGLVAVLEAASTTAEQFLQAVADIHREFPEVQPWLSWWILPGNGGMIFPAMQRMSVELRAQLPSSTNGAESAHNLLYGAAGRSHDIYEGVRRLYRVQRETELLYDAVLAGHVQPKFQGSKPQPMSRLTWYNNDGRAPDTRERLAAVAKLEADLMAQKSTLSEAERFMAANSAQKSMAVVAAANEITQQSLDKPLLQSYNWEANSCFFDAPLEAFFRPFIGMPDAVRADLMRRIRTECPDSGLRDVFEHLWLRGLLSGAIGADKNSKANDKPAKKETPKAVLNKLVTALDAGQRVVKRLIQAKWDGGRYVAGMAGCARTWPTQMMQFETTPRVQQYFSTRYKLKYICTSNHATETIHPNSCFETAIQRHDLAHAQAYIQSDADNPSLAEVLMHSIPRHRYGTRRGRSGAYIHEHESSLVCLHLSCNEGEAALVSISTEWPLLLRIFPQLPRVEGDIMLKDAYCPLTLKLGPEVEYELVSRVLYHPTESTAPTAVGHYTTQTRIGNRSYVYNDLDRNGALAELGPLHLLEDIDPLVISVIYLRRSRSNTTTRTRAELEADSAKVPALPPPSLVPDSDEQEPWIRELYADPISQNFYDDPRSDAEEDAISRMIMDTLEEPALPLIPTAKNDASPAKSDSTSSTTPCPIFCHGCGLVSDGDNLPDQVQCERCKFWSHMECLPDVVDWSNPEIEFICARCKPRSDSELFRPGEIVMLPYPGAVDWRADDVLWYLATFFKRFERSIGTVREFKFKWFQCDWLFQMDPDALPLLIPRTYQNTREFFEAVSGVILKSKQIGKICLPAYLKPEMSAPLDHPLVAVFSACVTRLAVVLAAFHEDHPVVHCYNQYFATKKSSARDTEAGEWLSNLRLTPTPELESLMQPPMHELLNRSVLRVPEVERRRRVLAVGSALLQLLAIQYELNEELNLNGDTLLDLLDGSIVPCKIDGTKALEAMFLATDPIELKHRRGWDINRFSQHMLKFNAEHALYDPTLRPQTFARITESVNPPTYAIVFDVPSILSTTDAPAVSPKRVNDEPAPEEPPAKRTKKATPRGGEGKKGVEVKTRLEARSVAPGARRSGRLAKLA